MESLPKNGYFFERRKMFNDAPFHNMQSFVPLNWQTSQDTTQEVIRAKHKYSREKKRVKSTYEQSVDQRWNKKRYLHPNYNTIDNNPSRVKNNDTLTREIQVFNQSKIISNQNSSPRNMEASNLNMQRSSSPPSYPSNGYSVQPSASRTPNTGQTIDNSYQQHKIKEKNQEQRIQPQQSATYRSEKSHQLHLQSQAQEPYVYQPDRKSSLYDSRQQKMNQPDPYILYNPETRNIQKESYNIPVNQRYAYEGAADSRLYSPSLLQDKNKSTAISHNPYPSRDLAKQLQKIYTGSQPKEYPFRNVKPDTLQNHLRQQTKMDRKRAYHVSLNLFKNR